MIAENLGGTNYKFAIPKGVEKFVQFLYMATLIRADQVFINMTFRCHLEYNF